MAPMAKDLYYVRGKQHAGNAAEMQNWGKGTAMLLAIWVKYYMLFRRFVLVAKYECNALRYASPETIR